MLRRIGELCFWVMGSHDLGVATASADLYRAGLFPVAVFSGGNSPTTRARFPRGEALGTPLDPDTYDYEAAVLWNAHAGDLRRRFSIHLRREVAKLAGLTQRAFRDHARISFAKVAEYQKRGAVHFHAVIRLDGPEDGDTSPPAWATTELLSDALHAAAAAAHVSGATGA